MSRIEQTILTNLITDDGFARAVLPFLKSEYFQDRSERLLYEHINKFIEEYNALPTVEALVIGLDADSEITSDDLTSVGEILDEMAPLSEYLPPDPIWLRDQTEEFCRSKAIYNAIMESIQILDDASDHSKESIPEILSDALAVSFDSHVGHDFLEDSETRFDFYHRTDTHYPFELEYFDKITGGGLVNKTLNCLMGGPGSGKTLALCHFASTYLTQGKNVLYITLEMAEERISERIDANLLNISLDDLNTIPRSIYSQKIDKLRASTQGKLIVKEFPTAQAGVGHFRHLFNELAMKLNFVPDILIIDYINICISSRYKPGANIGSYTLVKSIAEEFRGFAVEKNLPILTATQVNREGFGSSDFGMENTSESWGLPATCDLFLALITSDEMDALGQMMVKQLKNRYKDIAMYRRFVIGVDRKKMRLFDVSQQANDELTPDEFPPAFDDTTFGQKQKAEKDFSQIQMD